MPNFILLSKSQSKYYHAKNYKKNNDNQKDQRKTKECEIGFVYENLENGEITLEKYQHLLHSIESI